MNLELVLVALLVAIPATLTAIGALVTSLHAARKIEAIPAAISSVLTSGVADKVAEKVAEKVVEKVPVFSAENLAELQANTERITRHAKANTEHLAELKRMLAELQATMNSSAVV